MSVYEKVSGPFFSDSYIIFQPFVGWGVHNSNRTCAQAFVEWTIGDKLAAFVEGYEGQPAADWVTFTDEGFSLNPGIIPRRRRSFCFDCHAAAASCASSRFTSTSKEQKKH